MRRSVVKGLLPGLTQTNPCVIGGGWNSTCYCYVVVIIGIEQSLVFLCHLRRLRAVGIIKVALVASLELKSISFFTLYTDFVGRTVLSAVDYEDVN